ncbi:MAG: DUF4956 domain-containing protein [Candidatus Heimdallarchaeota archaeon]|nr:DUF4956 domain-containing protein [Candidatus Heimdallarchaeota archaeon]
MPEELSLSGGAPPLSLTMLLFNLVVGGALALVVRWHFQRFGSTLSNREEFAQVFPFVLLTTILIISVVKSSLALSLGLVGALSIVRFRTPIKEPEELAYLFISIAIGLGLGAERTLTTVVAALAILTMMAILKWAKREDINKNLYLSIDWHGNKNEQPEQYLQRLGDIISKHSKNCDLRRFDMRDSSIEATYFVDIASADNLSVMTNELRDTFPTVGVTFMDQSQLPGI